MVGVGVDVGSVVIRYLSCSGRSDWLLPRTRGSVRT